MGSGVAVIGGGISGLCTAYGLRKAGVEVVLFESGGSVGGNIRTETHDGFLIERGPNTALANRDIVELIEELGISNQLARPNPNARKRYVLLNGKLQPLPTGPIAFVTSPVFTTSGKLRIFREPFIRTTGDENESVGEFFERRFGREIADRAVDPFVSGIYSGDANKLSIRHAFPRLFEFEQGHRSVIRGLLFSKKDPASKLPKGAPGTIAFKNGMQTLTDALFERLGGAVHLNTAVSSIRGLGSGFALETDAGTEDFSAAVVCTPALVAAEMIDDLDPVLAKRFRSVYYPPVTVVHSAYPKEKVTKDPDGFGFLVPSAENRRILGSLWTSSVFENRAPEGYHLFTTFIGGSRRAELCDLQENELRQIAEEELREILGIDGEPVSSSVKKWQRAIPQYNIGYEKVVNAVEAFKTANRGVFFCSNFYKGISVGDCVKNGVATAREVVDFLNW